MVKIYTVRHVSFWWRLHIRNKFVGLGFGHIFGWVLIQYSHT